MKKPFFSIVIHTYNRVSDLQFALFCILRQTFRDFEVVICDNCSTDGTRKLVETLARRDSRIRYVRNRRNLGALPNLKKAISFACGSYVFLHSDDDFLFEETTLFEIYQKVARYEPGYVRVNYFCRTPDKKLIFDFTVNKPFGQSSRTDRRLAPGAKPDQAVSFMLASDPYFVTGIVFKNALPRGVHIIQTEPCSWSAILLYASQKYGAYFISKQLVVASWSLLRVTKTHHHDVFSLRRGLLPAEGFFGQVRKILPRGEYNIFLRRMLETLYIHFFPVIKLYTGNGNLVRVAQRIKKLDPEASKTLRFRVYLAISRIVSGVIWKIIRDAYFVRYSRFAKVANSEQVAAKLQGIYRAYESYR